MLVILNIIFLITFFIITLGEFGVIPTYYNLIQGHDNNILIFFFKYTFIEIAKLIYPILILISLITSIYLKRKHRVEHEKFFLVNSLLVLAIIPILFIISLFLITIRHPQPLPA